MFNRYGTVLEDWDRQRIHELEEKIRALEDYLDIEIYDVPLRKRYVKKEEK